MRSARASRAKLNTKPSQLILEGCPKKLFDHALFLRKWTALCRIKAEQHAGARSHRWRCTESSPTQSSSFPPELDRRAMGSCIGFGRTFSHKRRPIMGMKHFPDRCRGKSKIVKAQ
jgi:hypothetical protein